MTINLFITLLGHFLFEFLQIVPYNIFMKNIILILAVLVTCLNAQKVNVLTTFHVNQDQFAEEIVCTDCVQPVTISAEGLPNFIKLEGNKLSATAPPVPGQYHVTLNIEDGAGQTARVLVILLCQDEKTSNQTTTSTVQRPGDAIISIYSPQLLANLTTLLLNPNTLTQTQVRIQTILARQAAINNKIANLLILIRRYNDNSNQSQQEINNLIIQIQQLLPQQTLINEELLELENRLTNNRIAIKELIEFIKQARQDIEAQKERRNQLQQQQEQIFFQYIQNQGLKINIEARLVLRRQMLANMTGSGSQQCQSDAINQQNQIIDDIQNQNNTLIALISDTDDEIQRQNQLIDDLKRQLEEAQNRRNQALKNRYEFLGNLTTLEVLRQNALDKIQELQQKCDSAPGVDPQLIAALQNLINSLESELSDLQDTLTNQLNQIQSFETQIREIDSDINFITSTLDQAINDLQGLYNNNDEISARIAELKQQKDQIDQNAQNLRLRLEALLRQSDTSIEALENAKEQLAKALVEKQENDAEIENLLFNNLDIIRSVQGLGNYNFDMNRIAEIVGFNVQDLDFTTIHELNHAVVGDQPCISQVNFYGVGRIQAIEPGQVTILNNAGEQVVLHTPSCSINMATVQNYTAKQGDAICWKGHRMDGKWIISESIVIPAQI